MIVRRLLSHCCWYNQTDWHRTRTRARRTKTVAGVFAMIEHQMLQYFIYFKYCVCVCVLQCIKHWYNFIYLLCQTCKISLNDTIPTTRLFLSVMTIRCTSALTSVSITTARESVSRQWRTPSNHYNYWLYYLLLFIYFTHATSLLQRLTDGHVEIVVRLVGGQVDHIEFCINVNDLHIFVIIFIIINKQYFVIVINHR
jgi:hypothetical protein